MTASPVAELLDRLIAEARAAHPDRPALIGVAGAQGSGKSTLCRVYAEAHPRVAHFSMDDVYFTRADRELYARWRHPLFVTRGPPGTHDIALAVDVIASLSQEKATALPRFDKARDDRAPPGDWPVFNGPAETILIDGWCLGALPAEPSAPLNAVEHEDTDGAWREGINAELSALYATFFGAFDGMIYLQAPSWEIVRKWRGQQEEETLGRPLTWDEIAALDRFVMHYERLTRWMLAGGHRAEWIVQLDDARNVIAIQRRHTL